jgi:hypothetical protein
MTVLAVAAVILALGALSLYQGGFWGEYGLSAEVRDLSVALNTARFRAMDSEAYFRVTQTEAINPTAGNAEWYQAVRFTYPTASPYIPEVGDYVTFAAFDTSDLHVSMNGGIYNVSAADPTAKTFTCDFYMNVPSGTFTTDAPANAICKNLSEASQLIIAKQSAFDFSSQDYLQSRDSYYVYPDARMIITETRVHPDLTDEIPIGFNSRGLPAVDGGYRINMAKGVHEKVVIVSPLGKVSVGARFENEG